jgi:hypothetical protein
MISLFEGREGPSPVRTRDAVERVNILLNRASRYLVAGQNNLAEEATLSAQAILEQQEVVSVFDHLRALIIVGVCTALAATLSQRSPPTKRCRS